MKRSLRANGRLLTLSIKTRPLLAVLFVLYSFMGSIIPFLSTKLLQVATRTLLLDDRQAFFQAVLTISGLILAATGAKLFSKFKADSLITYVRMGLSNRLNEKLFNIKYANIESEEFLTAHSRAFSGLNSSGQGADKGLNAGFFLLSDILAVLLLTSVLTIISPWLIVLVIAYSVFLIIAFAANQDAALSHRTGLMAEERRSAYIYRLSMDTGDELRLYQGGSLLSKKSAENKGRMSKALKAIRNKERKGNILTFAGRTAAFVTMLFSAVSAGISGDIDFADIAMVLSASIVIMDITGHIATEIAVIRKECESVRELFDFLDSAQDDISPRPAAEEPTESAPALDITNLTFTYPGASQPVLCGLNLTLHKGQTAAIVGINGAGKSTLIKCLTGIYDAFGGGIRLFGRDIRSIPRDILYRQIGALFQDVCVYAFTLQENVASAIHNISGEKVTRCLKEMELGDRINEDDLETMALKVLDGEGVVLSGGQNQRLAFSRIRYKDPELYILDEPTAALDTLAEERILDTLTGCIRDKTCLFVTHRLPSVRRCDVIFVLDQGKITEHGTHDQLMETAGLYSELYATQARYYEEQP